ncbi:c-type cytochrome biogenesis protein CcmI [Rubrimonas cliftonensis]|uniref:Cytochrome c-type biogenesis protein CcmH n=1 Tax=Rubrimonas cliftonensis TaxID=89524 RepID=A0A1H3Z3T3_9RHOB|nr:c-type cytochrome biogenesis protein CcmI [Rubrimonas cliftonensis]SEA17982.1 cytochrome c-type biogenesis protein CcmH [Rubrimonas cliftonensis]
MAFWIIAAAAALAAAAWMARPLAAWRGLGRASGRASARPRAAYDEQVFRDQLAEVDRDLARGVLTDREADAARTEVSRRLLTAAAERARSADIAPAPAFASRALAVAVVVGAPLGAWALYGVLGAPGLPDQPLASRDLERPGQAVAEAMLPPQQAPDPGPDGAEAARLIGELEARMQGDGADAQGLYLLARSLAQVGRFGDSWRTYDRLIATAGRDAPAAIHVAKAEAMILAARGYVSPEAEAALEEGLRRSPDNPVARYYIGVAYSQTNRPRSALEAWSGLLRDSPPDAPWVESTRAQLAALAQETGLEAPQAETPEATRDAGAAMAQMAGALDARLAAEGGGPMEWAQLVRTWRALGREAEAADAEARARAALAGAAALAAFDAALEAPAPGAPAAPALPGPDAGAVAAAAQMPAGERMAMIRGMVDGLAERLYGDGGSPDEWARLIASLGVLGESEAQAEAYARARQAHADDATALAFLRERALTAGLDVE